MDSFRSRSRHRHHSRSGIDRRCCCLNSSSHHHRQTQQQQQQEQARRDNSDIDAYLRAHPLVARLKLDPPAAFYGGRTENTVTSYFASPTQKIKYTDICSLYPYVCKRGKFPLGHLRIYVGEECNALTNGRNDDFSRVEGLLKCRVLPPRKLYLPVLPVRANKRLLFPLCRSCCEDASVAEEVEAEGDRCGRAAAGETQRQRSECTHESAEERELSGTWVADELRKAVELGYRVLELQIVWQYDTTVYDQSTGQGGLVADQVNLFLKIKQEASGWPSSCVDELSKTQYVLEYEEAEGVKLEYGKIEKNAGLRAVAKLCLNSFWEKFVQRDNQRQTSIVKSREELLRLVLSPEKEIHDVLSVTADVMLVTWTLLEEVVTSLPHSSVVIAAYVTAEARLRLYEHLQYLGRRALYYDTDSCIFVCNDDDAAVATAAAADQSPLQQAKEYEPRIGNFSVEMTDELALTYDPGTYITASLSGGPKFYAYQTRRINECCKVKGISLTHENQLKINFYSVKRLLDQYFDDGYSRESNAAAAASIVLEFRSI